MCIFVIALVIFFSIGVFMLIYELLKAPIIEDE